MATLFLKLKIEIKKRRTLYQIILKSYRIYCFLIKPIIRWNDKNHLEAVFTKLKMEVKKWGVPYRTFIYLYGQYCRLINKRDAVVNMWSIFILDNKSKRRKNLEICIIFKNIIVLIVKNTFWLFVFLVRIHFSKKKSLLVIKKSISLNDQWFIDRVDPLIWRVYNKVALFLNLFILCFRKVPSKASSVLHVSLITTKAYMLSRLLRKHGLRSHYLAMNADIAERINIGYDYHIPYNISLRDRRWQELYYLWAVLARYDVIHFHFNTLLSVNNGWEIPYLKILGKVLVFHFRGCDLRQKSINMTVNPVLNCCQGCNYPEGSCDTEFQWERIKKAKQSGDLFFVTTPDLLDFFPEAEHIPFISPYGIDFDDIQPVEKKRDMFRIVTSSNHPGIDGVPYIQDAVARLINEGYPIELVEVIQKPFFEALSIYKSADLFAGKLTMGYYNNANIETMMMGIPNMSYIREKFLQKVPDCPIIIARPDNIYEKLKEWIQKPEELKKIGAKGPAFIKKYHDPDVVIDHMIRRYNEAFKKKTGNTGH